MKEMRVYGNICTQNIPNWPLSFSCHHAPRCYHTRATLRALEKKGLVECSITFGPVSWRLRENEDFPALAR